MLGYKSIHYDTARLNDVLDGANRRPTFRCYDDIDAVSDLPAALFYRELLTAYPEARAILTVRDTESWWRSIEALYTRFPTPPGLDLRQPWDITRFRAVVRNVAYGSSSPKEFLYKKKYSEHNAHVRREIPPARLLVIDIVGGEGWQKLCPFLETPIPNTPFPHENWPPAAATAGVPRELGGQGRAV
jgi:hypothetical protein